LPRARRERIVRGFMSSGTHSRTLPRLELAFAAVLFSTGGAAIKACSFGAWQVACLRSGVAAIALLLFLPSARRGYSLAALGFASVYAATLVLFVTANKLTTSANAIYLQSTAPLYVVILSPLVLRERIQRRDLAIMALFALGLACFFVRGELASRTAPDPPTGNWLALASGATFALSVIGLRKLSSGGADSSLALVVLGNALAAIACAPKAFPLEGARAIDWAVIVYLGVFQIGLAYVLVGKGLERVPALEGSLLLMIEPALNPIWTFFLQGERPSRFAICGGALILGASALKSVFDARAARMT
jgi:drug/metabolite transporter (DMT)-like permease